MKRILFKDTIQPTLIDDALCDCIGLKQVESPTVSLAKRDTGSNPAGRCMFFFGEISRWTKVDVLFKKKINK